MQQDIIDLAGYVFAQLISAGRLSGQFCLRFTDAGLPHTTVIDGSGGAESGHAISPSTVSEVDQQHGVRDRDTDHKDGAKVRLDIESCTGEQKDRDDTDDA